MPTPTVALLPPIIRETIGGNIYTKNITIDNPNPAGSKIYYTIDGTDPFVSSSKILYMGNFLLDSVHFVVMAYCEQDGFIHSPLMSDVIFLFDTSEPVFSVPSGTFPTSFFVSLSGDPLSSIYYTIDGSDPATSNTAYFYISPYNVTENILIRAVAKRTGYNNSDTVTIRYEIANYAMTPTQQTFISKVPGNTAELSESPLLDITIQSDSSPVTGVFRQFSAVKKIVTESAAYDWEKHQIRFNRIDINTDHANSIFTPYKAGDPL